MTRFKCPKCKSDGPFWTGAIWYGKALVTADYEVALKPDGDGLLSDWDSWTPPTDAELDDPGSTVLECFACSFSGESEEFEVAKQNTEGRPA